MDDMIQKWLGEVGFTLAFDGLENGLVFSRDPDGLGEQRFRLLDGTWFDCSSAFDEPLVEDAPIEREDLIQVVLSIEMQKEAFRPACKIPSGVVVRLSDGRLGRLYNRGTMAVVVCPRLRTHDYVFVDSDVQLAVVCDADDLVRFYFDRTEDKSWERWEVKYRPHDEQVASHVVTAPSEAIAIAFVMGLRDWKDYSILARLPMVRFTSAGADYTAYDVLQALGDLSVLNTRMWFWRPWRDE